MRIKSIVMALVISFSSVAETSKQQILTSLFDACMTLDVNACKSTVSGNESNVDFFLKSMITVRSHVEFKKLYTEAYGQEEFDNYNSEYNLTIVPLSSSDYKLEYSDSEKIIFIGPSNKVITLIYKNSKWFIDLNNSSLTPPEDYDVTAMNAIADLIIGSRLGLVKLIKKNAEMKVVYKTGKLYHLATIYDVLPPEKQQGVNDFFIENNTTLPVVKKEILAHAL